MAPSPTILLVEDDHFVARLYGHAFESCGLSVITVGNARDALLAVAGSPPDLLISDVNMQDMDGFELARTLKERGQKTFPLVFLTGQDDLSLLSRGLEAGGDGFLIKGADLLEIVERLSFWMQSGFSGLPAAARTRALKLAAAAKEGSQPIAGTVALDGGLVNSLRAQVAAEVAAAPKDYGDSPAERICFLGRISHLVLDACADLKSTLRFPDYFMASIKPLDLPWLDQLCDLLPDYDRLAQDPRFCAGAKRGLVAVADEGVE